jgi:phage gp29-like protein
MEITFPALQSINDGLNLAYNSQLFATGTKYDAFTLETNSTGAAEVYPRLNMLPGLREWIGDRQVMSLSQATFSILNRLFELTIEVARTDRQPYRPLLDQFENVIPPEDIAALREETAPVGGIYARPPFQGHIAWGINPQRLASIIRAADTGNTLDWFILAEEIEELYPHYATVLAKRKRQVVQLPITVEAADEKNKDYVKHADFVREWLKTDVLQLALFDIADAIGKGFSACEIVWEQDVGMSRPAQLIYNPQRFFEFNPLDMKTLWLRTEGGFQDLQPHKWLVHLHPSKSGNIARSSLARMVAFLWCYATFTAKDWALFTQTYGLPPRVGKYGPSASDNDKRTLWRAVSSIAGDVAAMIPESMQIEFISLPDKAAGAQLYEKRADWLDRTVSRLVLGGDASTSAVAGSHAVGKTHREGEDDVEKFDAFMLNASINRQLVQTMVAFTFGPQPAYPTASLGRPNEIPLKDFIDGTTDFIASGLPVKASEMRERLQLTKPEDGDEVIGGDKPEAPPTIPHPPVTPPIGESMNTGRLFAALLARHTEASGETPDEIVEALSQRLAEDAAGAMAGLTDGVRTVFHNATDMRDLARRLRRLNLSPDEFGEAMARGVALAQLVGQASLIEDLRARRLNSERVTK